MPMLSKWSTAAFDDAIDATAYAISPSFRASHYTQRDEYIMRRYRDLVSMAREMTGRDGPEVVMGLAVIDLTIEIKDLPNRMPRPIFPENKIDVRLVTDHINAAMSELYK